MVTQVPPATLGTLGSWAAPDPPPGFLCVLGYITDPSVSVFNVVVLRVLSNISPQGLFCVPSHTGAMCGRIKDRTDSLSLEVPRVRSSAGGNNAHLCERGSPICGELSSSCGEL